MLKRKGKRGPPVERLVLRAQIVVADALIAAFAFVGAYLVSTAGLPPQDLSVLPLPGIVQLTAVYGALAAIFSFLFRRELSPWRYASIPDALVLARVAVLTVGVFLVAAFVMDRGNGLPRSALFIAPLFQMVGCMGLRILRRALHEKAFDSFAPLTKISERMVQAPPLLLIGSSSLADTYLRDARPQP
jgi:O-antigen biosynthesis protein WbqV